MEVFPFDSYQVQVHGSRTVTQRNRRFLRKFSPFQPAIPGRPGDCLLSLPPVNLGRLHSLLLP